MVGHLGALELAGVSFANAIFIIGMVTANCFTQGILPAVGQCFGSGDSRKITEYFANSWVINTIMVLVMCAIMSIVGIFMDKMGQDPAILGYAKSYYWIMVLSMIPTMIFFSTRFFSEGLGNTKNAMYITLSINLLNILLNWLLIFGKWGLPAMGVSGAAIATLISRILAAGVFILLLFVKEEYKPYMKGMRGTISRATMRSLLKLSLPISLQGFLEVFAFSLAIIMVGWIGAYELAAHQVAHSLSTLTFMIALGIGSATTIRVSHQYGAGNFIGLRMAGKAAIHMSVAMMGSLGLIFILFNKYIPMLYTADENVIKIASPLIIVMSLYQVFDAIQMASGSALRGLKDINIPLIFLTVAYYLICLPCAYLLAFVFDIGVIGVWIGLLLGLAFAAVMLYSRFNKLSKKLL